MQSLFDFKALHVGDKTMYTVIGCYEGDSYHAGSSRHDKRQLYNGIIITPSFNPVLFDVIIHICAAKTTDYHYIVRKFYDVVQGTCDTQLQPGLNKMNNGWNVYLAKETTKPDPTARYGIRCKILDHNDNLICNTRYDGYGISGGDWL